MKHIDEGYIKFNCEWIKQKVEFISSEISVAAKYRDKLYEKGLIGMFDNGIGFGNLSYREKITGNIVITGSQTGGIENIDDESFTRVLTFDIDLNYCKCEGFTKASSETLSHAVIYNIPEVNAVIHIHNLEMWNFFLDKLPTTPKYAEFGSVELANEIGKLVEQTGSEGVFVMGGHEEGIIAYADNISKAYDLLMNSFDEMKK